MSRERLLILLGLIPASYLAYLCLVGAVFSFTWYDDIFLGAIFALGILGYIGIWLVFIFYNRLSTAFGNINIIVIALLACGILSCFFFYVEFLRSLFVGKFRLDSMDIDLNFQITAVLPAIYFFLGVYACRRFLQARIL